MKKIGKILRVLLLFVLVATALGALLSCQKGQTPDAKRAALIQEFSDGRYDKDFNLVDLAGTVPVDLANSQRAVLVAGFIHDENGKPQQVSANVALGWIYGKEYVTVPIQLFYAMDPILGPIPLWQMPEVTFMAYLLPDLRVDDEWQQEELGAITINEILQIAVIKRTKPVINAKTDNIIFGKYEELEINGVGDVLYVTSQANGRITVKPSMISEVYVNNNGRKLFSDSRNLMFSELGGLAFTLRDGKPELIGFLSVAEQSQIEGSGAYIHYTDIQEIADFIKTIK